MRSFSAASRMLVIAVLTGLVALTTLAFGPSGIAQPQGSLSLVKSASPSVGVQSGDTVTYTFVVTNTGGTPISDISVDEIAFTGSGPVPDATCPAGTLQPGQSVTCTATYDVTDADEGACLIDNTATATGSDPQQIAVTSAPSSTRVVTACQSGFPGSAILLPGLGLSGLGSLAVGSVGALGSLGLGSLGALGALGFWALTTPYQPGPGAPCTNEPLPNVPFLNVPLPNLPFLYPPCPNAP
ncbi:hypothetical protein [Rhodococcus sp. ABRD24]|uniref:DUF7507 domain-containing protein n=1 Tax=Rhodococcus sp. ABRD24 TaxID=2507582 RepID=UPI001F6200FD|nr:hypothetical protein [Rhodococcus sp. ABRD24]